MTSRTICLADVAAKLVLPDTPVETGPAADRLLDGLGALGCALEGRIFLRSDLRGAERRRVATHEAVHVAQQRLPGPARPIAAEVEAHDLAALWLAGRGGRPCVPLDARLPACWEEAGHYYTCYYVLMAAGATAAEAYRLAAYCQFPDKVLELDAVVAGIKWGQGAAAGTVIEDAAQTYASGHISMADNAADMTAADSFEVSVGLHALSGEDWNSETAKRLAILNALNPAANELAFGMGLHALGDSYAHRHDGSGRMYPPIVGHSTAGHEPDCIGPHREQFYRDYVGDMYRLVKRKFAGPALLPEARVVANLVTVIPPTENAPQAGPIAAIRGLAAGMGCTMMAYAPEKVDGVTFSSLVVPVGVKITQLEFIQAKELARKWSFPTDKYIGVAAVKQLLH